MSPLAPANLKAAALSSCRYTGLFALARLLTGGGVRVLAYHRFTRAKDPAVSISQQSFEQQMAYLARRFQLLTLEDYLKIVAGEVEPPQAAALVTIDDGYADAYTIAYPVLRKYGVPATVFVALDFVEGRAWLWPDKVSYALRHTAKQHFTLHLNGGRRPFDLTRGWAAVKAQLDEVCTSLGSPEREALIAQLLEELGVVLPERPTLEYAPLSWPQIREMDRGLISFGSHTCSHPILSKVGAEEARGEIARSKTRLEGALQHEVTAFCYPNGTAADFTAETARLVQDCGYRCAFSTIYGLNYAGADPYRLRRMVQGESPLPRFLQNVSGLGVLKGYLRGDRGQTGTG